MRLDELAAPSRSSAPARRRPTAPTSPPSSRPALARAGSPVVSGAAFGIDQAAHRGALAAGGLTVAVLACGVDRAYPAAHRGLLDHLADDGAVVSELPPGCAPTRLRFLARNRLIAGLARGTVVVEAAAAQRRAQHRQLGRPAQPAADGRARAGHQRTVARASTS